MVDSAEALVASIREAGLLAPERLEELVTLWLPRTTDPRELALQLVQAGWLTVYQAQQLLLGRVSSLVVGAYDLLERLGAGGMGEVFRARHRHLNRPVALKVIRKQRQDQANVIQRFLREAETAARLSHPNIVTVYDGGMVTSQYGDMTTHFLAMELIEGVDLGRLVEQVGPLPVAQACDFIRQVSLGLHYAHEQGLVHRDIKPTNLLVARPSDPSAPPGDAPPRSREPLTAEHFLGGTVKVLDMGLVHIAGSTPPTQPRLTEQGVLLGTVDYLAPEQALNAQEVDRRTDLYALGCTFYYLLTGQPPFPGGLPLDKLGRHQTETPALVSDLRPDVPAELAALIGRLLAKHRADRFQTAEELAEALLPWLNHSTDFVFDPTQGVAPTEEGYEAMPPTRIMNLPSEQAPQPPMPSEASPTTGPSESSSSNSSKRPDEPPGAAPPDKPSTPTAFRGRPWGGTLGSLALFLLGLAGPSPLHELSKLFLAYETATRSL